MLMWMWPWAAMRCQLKRLSLVRCSESIRLYELYTLASLELLRSVSEHLFVGILIVSSKHPVFLSTLS